MSKIDDFKVVKDRMDKAVTFAKEVQDNHHADKFGALVAITESYLGYYGNSSTHRWGDNLVIEMEKQIKLDLRMIAKRMAERMSQEAEAVRKLAVEEARLVLEEIGK